MEKIGLVTDEVSDIPEDLIRANDIGVVRYKIDFQDLGGFAGNVFQKIREGERRGIKTLIKTSQPSINDFLSQFKEKLEKFEQVLCITFSSKVSGAYNSAIQARKFLQKELQGRVYIFDSLNGSGAEGLVILRATRMIRDKMDIHQIISSLKDNLGNVRLLGMYKSPKWLEASGRFPSILASILNKADDMEIKPVFGLRGGRLVPVGIKKNVKDLAAVLFGEFERATTKARESGKKIMFAITHADCDKEAGRLKEMALGLGNTEVSFVNLVCFPVGGHIGPDSMIISWDQQ